MVMIHKTTDKLQPKWEGPFMVETVYSNRAYLLTNPNGDTLLMPINEKFFKVLSQITLTPYTLIKKVLYMTKLTLNLWSLRHTCLTISSPPKYSFPQAESTLSLLFLGLSGWHQADWISEDILRHDVNIEEKIKTKILILALSPFSFRRISLILKLSMLKQQF